METDNLETIVLLTLASSLSFHGLKTSSTSSSSSSSGAVGSTTTGNVCRNSYRSSGVGTSLSYNCWLIINPVVKNTFL